MPGGQALLPGVTSAPQQRRVRAGRAGLRWPTRRPYLALDGISHGESQVGAELLGGSHMFANTIPIGIESYSASSTRRRGKSRQKPRLVRELILVLGRKAF